MGDNLEQRFFLAFDKLLYEAGITDIRGKTILAAVSGGADSMALLCLLHQLAPVRGFVLQAVTVNHRIRSEAESMGDARCAESFCASLTPVVPCTLVSLEPGEVSLVAENRGKGIEEAARFLRYKILDETAIRAGASVIMTAHNRNDRNETILMRFLQGAGGRSLAGISAYRGAYIRPLLDISHGELVAYLKARNIIWREDATNADNSYLRNRIRSRLVPALERFFPGWETGIHSFAEKALLDDDLCRSLIRTKWIRSGDRIFCALNDYSKMHPAVRLRFLGDGLKLIKPGYRVSGGYLLRLAHETVNDRLRIAGSGLLFEVRLDSIFFGPDIVQNTKSGYLVYIVSSGIYRLPFGSLAVSGADDSVFLDQRLGPFTLPLIVRSRTGGDTVKTADGRQKTIKKLMNDWAIAETDRDLVPIVEQDGEIRAIYGSPLGYPDWYVQP